MRAESKAETTHPNLPAEPLRKSFGPPVTESLDRKAPLFRPTRTSCWWAMPAGRNANSAASEISGQRQDLKHSCGTPSNHLSQHLLCGRSPCPPCLPRGICKWMCFPVDSFDGCFASSNPKPAPQFAATHKILSALPGSPPISTARPLLWGVPGGCSGISSEVEVTRR